jgi:hypothetical protein
MNEIQILYDTHQHHVLSTQSGLRYLKIAKKGYEGERDKVMVLRELKLLAAALYVGRQGVIPGGVGPWHCLVCSAPPPWPNWREPQPCNCLQTMLRTRAYSHRWLPLEQALQHNALPTCGRKPLLPAIADLLLSSYPNARLFDRRVTDFMLLV